jgi:hypothetical protein
MTNLNFYKVNSLKLEVKVLENQSLGSTKG